MRSHLNVLLVEDSAQDARLIELELGRHHFELNCKRVQTEPEFRSKIDAAAWDVIIADYRLPGFNALAALEIIQEKRLDIPFIIVSGTIGEEVAVAAMKAGAHDYVMKDKLARLVPAVERELGDAESRRARLKAEANSRLQANLLGAVGQAVVATDFNGRITYWNSPAQALYGWTETEALGQNLKELVKGDESEAAVPKLRSDLAEGRSWFGELSVRRRDGTALTALVTESPLFDAFGKLAGMIQVATDVTERKTAELQLAESREQLRALAGRLQAVREEERKELSRDIHDELGQVLTGLKMELAWMRSRLNDRGPVARKALLEKIAVLGSHIDSSADCIRKLCAQLRPGILDDLGLEAAVEWQAREFAKRTGIQCDLACELSGVVLGPDESTTVFRIFQEILTNVARHARATRVAVKLVASANRLMLEAEDNGRGIQPEEMTGSKSLGLLGMRERAMALGGSIEFNNCRGGGTLVRLIIPLSR